MKTPGKIDGRRSTTLVLGGTGKTGRRIAERLIAQGVPVRVAARSTEPAFNWDDPNTWEPVLQDAAAVYVVYYPDVAAPGASERIRRIATLAVESGVRRMVLQSGHDDEKALASEQAIRTCGAAYTILQPAFFFQNFSEGILSDSVMSGELAFPAGDVREPFVDVDDLADVAVAALTDAKHEGQTYVLTGPRLLTFAEAVAEISEAAGRPIRYVPISTEQFAEALSRDAPPEFATFFSDLLRYLLDGHRSYLADGVQKALGRHPRDFRDYARIAAAAGAWGSRR